MYDRIDLSYYPEQRSQAKYYSKARELVSILKADEETPGSSGFVETTRNGFEFVDDTALFPNLGRAEVFYKCGFRNWKMVVRDRIYPCCVASGLVDIRGLSPLELSVPLDANWRESLLKVENSMSEGACQQCWVDCEKWRHLPAADLFNLSGPGVARPATLPDILSVGGSHLGGGWLDIEQFGGEIFRWVENDAEIVLDGAPEPVELKMLVEAGPGLRGRELVLQVLNSDGDQIGVETVIGRGEASFYLPAGCDRSLRLHVEGGGQLISADPRVLNFRVFAISTVPVCQTPATPAGESSASPDR